ncbi:MAG: hypothetical protein ACOVQ6_00600 [Brevundimonas sp.]
MSDERRQDILYAKMNALEIMVEEVLAELLRTAKDPDETLKRIGAKTERRVEEMQRRGQLTREIQTGTRENVARLTINLSIAIQGSIKPRNPGI